MDAVGAGLGSNSAFFCGAHVGLPYQHVLVDCPSWAERRMAACACISDMPARAKERTMRILSVLPGDDGYAEVASWLSEVDCKHKRFWRDQGVIPSFVLTILP